MTININKGFSIKKILLFLLMFAIFTPLAMAATWEEFGHKTYIDKSSIKYIDSGAIFWLKILNDGTLEDIDGKKVWYMLSKYEINCKKRQFRVLSSNFYDLKKYPLVALPYTSSWTDIPPDSNAEIWHRIFCKYDKFRNIYNSRNFK